MATKSIKAKKLEVAFFCTELGTEPVREWLKKLPKAEKQEIGIRILEVQHRWPVGEPLVGYVRDGIREVRIELPGKWARVLFCMHKKTKQMVLLHGIMKKTNKLPKADIDLAETRMKKLE